jgi:ubiquinone/menaquinone biosynthesis C-methylase UbiE
MKETIRDLCPPILWRGLVSARAHLNQLQITGKRSEQDLDVYWDPEMATLLEQWGQGNAWNEIQLLMENSSGKVLDMACGTGKVMEVLKGLPRLEIHGCDISDMLITKATERGLLESRLKICDATQLPYADETFDYSYSIGSLEHFTEDGIEKAIAELARVTKRGSYHMMPTSRSNKDEGWLKTYQSFHNCSTDWWVARFQKSFSEVIVLESRWEDKISVGSWFICRQ